MSGFLRPAAAKMSITSSEATALETIWRMAGRDPLGIRPSAPVTLDQRGRPGRRRPRRGSPSPRSWAPKGRRPWTVRHGLEVPRLAVGWARMCSWASGNTARRVGRLGGEEPGCSRSRGTCRHRLRTSPASPRRPRLVDGGTARAAALGVGGQGLAQLVGDAEIVHDQPARLVRNTRLTRAMACISPWPRMGLSTYMVCSRARRSRSATCRAR
jgi:hypothetical protein